MPHSSHIPRTFLSSRAILAAPEFPEREFFGDEPADPPAGDIAEAQAATSSRRRRLQKAFAAFGGSD
jgi:hypothetical protein